MCFVCPTSFAVLGNHYLFAVVYPSLGGQVVLEGEPTIIEIANSWLILNKGGGPTDDKPTITLHTPQNLASILFSFCHGAIIAGQDIVNSDIDVWVRSGITVAMLLVYIPSGILHILDSSDSYGIRDNTKVLAKTYL